MKRVVAICAALAVLLVLSSAAAAADKERSINGTVSGLDMSRRTMVVKDSGGADHLVQWNENTQLGGGPLEQGAAVKVKVNVEAGKLVATSIDVKASGSKPGEKPPQDQR